MSEWVVKKGNTAIQTIPITDENGDAVKDMGDATAIKFQVKEGKRDETAKIAKTKDDGIEVLTGDDLGKLKITLKPADNNIDVKSYFMGLQIEWSADKQYEVDITVDGKETDVFRIEQDVIQ